MSIVETGSANNEGKVQLAGSAAGGAGGGAGGGEKRRRDDDGDDDEEGAFASFRCPVCFELARGIIYTCLRGHLICAECIEKVL